MIEAGSERALILAPLGRDGFVAAAILKEAFIDAAICESVDRLVAELKVGAGFALVTDETLKTADLRGLAEWLHGQPPWSDFPFVLLTQRGGGLERNPSARRHLDLLGNVTFVERPFHPTTLISLAQSALRGRRRQYEARSRLQELHDNALELEARVEERTAELQANERRLRAMFESSFIYQCLITPEGLLADANAASLEGIKANLSDVVGRPIWESAWVSGTPNLVEVVRRRFREITLGAILRTEMAFNLPTGRRTFDLSLRPMHDGAGAVTAVMMEAMDITERRAAEEGLRQSQKLEAVGQLTGGVAHDFNNLLMPILGALDLLQRRYPGKLIDARATKVIEGALQSAERAKTLVQRLLGFARRQALDRRAVDIGALLEGVQDLLKSSLGANVEFDLKIADGLPATVVDTNQLELALLNLCVNARDAMPDGGVLTIDAAVERMEAAGASPSDYVRISVTDSGAGMDAETLARAVEPFFSTKPTGQGTGLGLSMVHGLAAQLGGSFTLVSEPGRGTTATLYLLAAQGLSAAAAIVASPSLASLERTLSILLVDDEDLVRSSTAEMLRDLGHRVVQAASGLEALGCFATDGEFDLLITDYKMPRMNGAQLAERIRNIRPSLPILLITGYTGVEEEAPDLMRLAKPFRQADLAEALVKIAA